MTIGALLFNYVKEHDLGEVFAAETGFIVEHATDENGLNTDRRPDVSFIRKERIPEVSFELHFSLQ